MAGFWETLTDYLSANQADPLTYLFIFFLFCVGAAIILPIPIEIFLVIDPGVHFAWKALVMGLGKGSGAIAVFFIGYEVEGIIMRATKWGWFKWLLDKSEILVRRYGYVAMYAIMSIPGMIDTIPLYIFSVLNKEGKLMTWQWFAVVNALAGITRAGVIYVIFFVFQVPIFGEQPA